MKILDFHVHVARREHLTSRFLNYYKETLGAATVELLDNLTQEAFIAFLDREEVHRTVILSEYSPKVTGRVPSEFTAQFCRGTDRLIPFGSIDLESPVAPAEQTERCVTELGCRGLKLLPSYGHYDPNDPRMMPAYEVARDLGIPVMFHTGTSLFPGTRVRLADPLLLDDLADEIDDLSIIMCHGGRPFWYKQAQWMLHRHKNVYIDISGIPPKQLPGVFPKLERFSDRFIFGSDWPNVMSIRHQVEQILALPFDSGTMNRILWDNGARLLGLE
ncbi:amidohydrolase family protein [Thermodesulfobacteriota bacterium]